MFRSRLQEIAANFNNQDLEQYANYFGLNAICKNKWASPAWPPTQHQQIVSGSSSPTNENDETVIIQDDGDGMDDKHDDQNVLMIDHSSYTPQFTVEQLQLIQQLQVCITNRKTFKELNYLRKLNSHFSISNILFFKSILKRLKAF